MNLLKVKVLIGYLLFSSFPIYSMEPPNRNTQLLPKYDTPAPITDYSAYNKKPLLDKQKLIQIKDRGEILGYVLTSDLGFFSKLKDGHYETIGRQFFLAQNPYNHGTFDEEAIQFIEECFAANTTKAQKGAQSFIVIGSFELKHGDKVLRILTFGQNMSSEGVPQRDDPRHPEPGAGKFHAERVAIQKVHDLLLNLQGQELGINVEDQKLWKTETRYDDVRVKFYGKSFNGLLAKNGICGNCAHNLNRFFMSILKAYTEKDLDKHCLNPSFTLG